MSDVPGAGDTPPFGTPPPFDPPHDTPYDPPERAPYDPGSAPTPPQFDRPPSGPSGPPSGPPLGPPTGPPLGDAYGSPADQPPSGYRLGPPPGAQPPSPYAAPGAPSAYPPAGYTPPYPNANPYGGGYAQPGYGYASAGPKNDGLAIASMITSIVGIVLLCACIGLIGTVAGLIMGFVARNRINQSNGMLTGDGFALAGIIVGGIGSVLGVLYVILALAS